MPSGNYSHMSYDDRMFIESQLNISDISLKLIAASLGRDCKTIREEIRKHRYVFIQANRRNKCGRQSICAKRRLCTHCASGLCKLCHHNNCNELCSDFISEPVCSRVQRFPFVCSNCPDLSSCKMPKFFYKAEKAQAEYRKNITDWKTGPRKSAEDMKNIISVFEDGIPRGIAPDILIHRNYLNISTSTAYRYIHLHHMGAIIPLSLKRAVGYKEQDRSKPKPVPINYDFLNGRRYQDFCNIFLDLDPTTNIWEMDTVLGKKGTRKCVLSLLHRKTNLQLFFLLDECSMLEVQRVFDGIRSFLGQELFKHTFTIILTDNGSEFHDPISIEVDPDSGEKLISVFFCHPRRSDEKGKCEKNHEHFREMVPKGVDMSPLSRKDIRYVSNNVNNYARKELDYRSPFEIACNLLNKKVLELNKLSFIPIKDVKLTPIIR